LVKTAVVASVSVEGIEYPLGLVLPGVIAGVGGRQPRQPVYCLQHLPDAQPTVVGDPTNDDYLTGERNLKHLVSYCQSGEYPLHRREHSIRNRRQLVG
jgi:hypothetical protein